MNSADLRTPSDHKRRTGSGFRLTMTRDEYAIRAANAVYKQPEKGVALSDAIIVCGIAIVMGIFYAMC